MQTLQTLVTCLGRHHPRVPEAPRGPHCLQVSLKSPGNDKEWFGPPMFESTCVGSKATQKLWLGFGAVQG